MMLSIGKAMLFILYVLVSTIGLFRMKTANAIISVEFLTGFGCYVFGFLLWIGILRIFPLSLAFPVAAGSLIIATVLSGFFFLEETMPLSKSLGIGMIMMGIVLVYYNQTAG